jgi:hypothetical protein
MAIKLGVIRKYRIYIIIIIIINDMIFITFIEDVYNYIPGTNLVSRVYNFTAILWFQHVVDVKLFPTIEFVLLLLLLLLLLLCSNI